MVSLPQEYALWGGFGVRTIAQDVQSVKYRVDYKRRTGWKYRCWDSASNPLSSNSFIFFVGSIWGYPADFRRPLAALNVVLYPGCAFNYIRGNRK